MDTIGALEALEYDHMPYLTGQYNIVADSSEPGNATESATFTPVVGWTYYIRVYPYSGFSSQQSCHLAVTYN